MYCGSLQDAAVIREGIFERLDGMGILIHDDALKTRMLLSGPEN